RVVWSETSFNKAFAFVASRFSFEGGGHARVGKIGVFHRWRFAERRRPLDRDAAQFGQLGHHFDSDMPAEAPAINNQLFDPKRIKEALKQAGPRCQASLGARIADRL